LSEVELKANVEAAGVEAARQLNRLADMGVKILVATVPDIGVTPFAYAEKAANADTDRAALLTRLTQSFNGQMRATMYNDGRRIGLILLDELVDAIAKTPGADGITNATDPVCDLSQSRLTPPSSLDCTTLTLVPNGSTAYLWADFRHLSDTGQNILGSNAITRAHNNSF
jgi:phospholipase/lecithinase/hemolysin